MIRSSISSLLKFSKGSYAKHLRNTPEANQGISTSNSKISIVGKKVQWTSAGSLA